MIKKIKYTLVGLAIFAVFGILIYGMFFNEVVGNILFWIFTGVALIGLSFALGRWIIEGRR